MTVNLCGECYLQGYCRRLKSKAVIRDELTPAFIADVRHFMRTLDIGRDCWAAFIIAAYQDYPGRIVDASDEEVDLDTEVFATKSISYWFRDLCRPIPPGTIPRVRKRARKRFLVLASILRARFPVHAQRWGRIVANDHEDDLPMPVYQPECPFPHFP